MIGYILENFIDNAWWEMNYCVSMRMMEMRRGKNYFFFLIYQFKGIFVFLLILTCYCNLYVVDVNKKIVSTII